MNKAVIKALAESIDSCSVALASELESENLASNTADDISARYWLMTFLTPLDRKELKSIVDGFLIQMLNDDQAKKIVKFLLMRFPHYYKDALAKEPEPKPEPKPEPLNLPDDFLVSEPAPTATASAEPDIISAVFKLMSTDSHSPSDNRHLVSTYENASPSNKALIDDVFISLCGYSMETIMEMTEEVEEAMGVTAEYEYEELIDDLQKIVEQELSFENMSPDYRANLEKAHKDLEGVKGKITSEKKLKEFLSFIRDTVPREQIFKAINRYQTEGSTVTAQWLDLHCKECGEDVEVYCDGDNAMMCPECRSVDCFEEREDEETTAAKKHVDSGIKYLKELLKDGKAVDTDEANDHLREVLGLSNDDIQKAYESLPHCDDCSDITTLRPWKFEPEVKLCENCYEQRMNDEEG